MMLHEFALSFEALGVEPLEIRRRQKSGTVRLPLDGYRLAINDEFIVGVGPGRRFDTLAFITADKNFPILTEEHAEKACVKIASIPGISTLPVGVNEGDRIFLGKNGQYEVVYRKTRRENALITVKSSHPFSFGFVGVPSDKDFNRLLRRVSYMDGIVWRRSHSSSF